jgi:hypothetical protein
MVKTNAGIDPGKSIAYRHKQSKFAALGDVLPLRWIAAGPSGAGKGVTMQNLILKHFRGCWERIYVFSPTAVLDKSTWDPVRKYIQEEMGVDLRKEPAFFTEFEPAVLEGIVKKHSEVVQKQKDRGDRKLFGALIIVDDFGDDASVLHKGGGSVLNRLFLSGRHHAISTIVAVQKLTLVSTPIRVNATGLLAFKVRNQREYEAIESEVTALVDRETFREIWKECTSEPYSFLFIRLNAKSLDETFMKRFEYQIKIE